MSYESRREILERKLKELGLELNGTARKKILEYANKARKGGLQMPNEALVSVALYLYLVNHLDEHTYLPEEVFENFAKGKRLAKEVGRKLGLAYDIPVEEKLRRLLRKFGAEERLEEAVEYYNRLKDMEDELGLVPRTMIRIAVYAVVSDLGVSKEKFKMMMHFSWDSKRINALESIL